MARYLRPGYARRRKARNRKILIIAVAAVVLIALVIALLASLGGNPDEKAAAQPTAVPTAAPTVAAEESAEPTTAPTPSPTPVPTPESPRAAFRPEPYWDGYLPVFRCVETTEEKIICITVDDCNEAANMRAIIDLAQAAGGKLTFFPIGDNVMNKPGVAEALRLAYELGYEIENHSYSHSRLYELSTEEMAAEIYKTQLAVCWALDLNYQMHFMRTRGGDNRFDLRTHQYIEKLGYYGMASWNESGAMSIDELRESLAPGNIYLFHCKDSDLERLQDFIPYAVSQGYQLVTMNEMFGFAPNATSPLTVPVSEMPLIEPDEYVYPYDKDIESGAYLYDVFLMQERLAELGYLESGPTGYYGKLTAFAVGLFQQCNGLEATGAATIETQRRIFAPDAVPADDEARARVAEYTAENS